MKKPSDGWDRDEEPIVEQLDEELEALQARHAGKPEIALLRAARHEALPADVQARVQPHLDSDPWNRAVIDGLDEIDVSFEQSDANLLLARIRQDAARDRSAPAARGWLRPALAIAALVAIGSASWLMLRQPASPSALPPRADQPIAAAPVTPAFQLPFDKPDVTLSLAAMTWRGSQGSNQLLADLKTPLDAYREGNYLVAERAFTALEARYPDAVEVFFYGGVTRVYLDQPDRALTALARAGELADPTFADRVNWYRAVAEQRAGRTADARNRLQALCRDGRTYAPQACRAIEQMETATKTPTSR